MLTGQYKRCGVPKLGCSAVTCPSLHHPKGLREPVQEDAISADIHNDTDTQATRVINCE